MKVVYIITLLGHCNAGASYIQLPLIMTMCTENHMRMGNKLIPCNQLVPIKHWLRCERVVGLHNGNSQAQDEHVPPKCWTGIITTKSPTF